MNIMSSKKNYDIGSFQKLDSEKKMQLEKMLRDISSVVCWPFPIVNGKPLSSDSFPAMKKDRGFNE